MFHPSEYAPAAEFWTNNQSAFLMPLKTQDDEYSTGYSFAFSNNILIGKSSNDNYFEIGSFCHNDQFMVPSNRSHIRDSCHQCSYDP